MSNNLKKLANKEAVIKLNGKEYVIGEWTIRQRMEVEAKIGNMIGSLTNESSILDIYKNKWDILADVISITIGIDKDEILDTCKADEILEAISVIEKVNKIGEVTKKATETLTRLIGGESTSS